MGFKDSGEALAIVPVPRELAPSLWERLTYSTRDPTQDRKQTMRSDHDVRQAKSAVRVQRRESPPQHDSWRKQYFHFKVGLEGTDNVAEW